MVQKSIAYSYDPFGNRIGTAVTVGGVTTYTYDVYDGGNLYLEVTDPNHLATGGASAVQSHRYFYAGAGIPLASDNCNGQANWGLTDGNGTVRDVTNSSGVVQDHRTYTSSGVMSQTNAAVDYIFGFDDLVWDGNAKLNFTPAPRIVRRWAVGWSPTRAVFSAGDSNLYRAFGNNSTINVDPSGLWDVGVSTGGSLTGSPTIRLPDDLYQSILNAPPVTQATVDAIATRRSILGMVGGDPSNISVDAVLKLQSLGYAGQGMAYDPNGMGNTARVPIYLPRLTAARTRCT